MDSKEKGHFNKGVFTLSLDTEIAWGMIDKPRSLIDNKEYFYNTRKAIDGIIELLDKYQISATWGMVGSLLLDEPKFEAEFIESITKNLESDIKKQYIDLLKDKDIWGGKDILKKIKSSLVPQEIGSHSYNHIIFDDDYVTKETAFKEYIDGKDILRKHGEDPISFIFPRNGIKHLSELKDAGFETYRGIEPSWYINMPGKMKKACHIIDQTLSITPPVVTPINNSGLINIPASMFYLPMNGFRKYIPLNSRTRKAKKGIKRAINEKKIFHLWFHPFNIATNREELLRGLETIFKKVNKERENGNIQVMTMSEVMTNINN